MGMYNFLEAEVTCPYCQKKTVVQAELKLGLLTLANYKLGDWVQWGNNDKGLQFPKKRPLNGNIEAEAYTECPNCGKDFWLQVTVENDQITNIRVDVTKKAIFLKN